MSFVIKKVIKKVIKNKYYLILLIPALIYFFIFYYLPMVGALLAFKKYNYADGIFGSPWCGLDNFKFMFINGDIFGVIRNTALYNIAFIIVNTTFEIFLAILLSEIGCRFFKKISQGCILFPYFISWVVVGTFVYNMFNYEFGAVNGFLKSINIDPINIYNNPTAWIPIIIFIKLWKEIGYGTVLYLAAISSIDQEMYEAAEIDGANIFRRIRHITIPSLLPTIIILVLLSIGNVFKGDFQMFYQLVGSNSMVYSTTDVIDTFVTRSLLNTREFGMTTAAGIIQSVFGLIVIVTSNCCIKKYDRDYALY